MTGPTRRTPAGGRRRGPAGGSWCALDASGADFPRKTATDTFTQTEQAFQAQVVAYARLMGWTVWHDVATNAPRACRQCKAPLNLPRNDAGFPDLVLVRRPRVVWAELKSERGKLTDDQADWIRTLRACGQDVHVWKPSDWRDVEEVLR